MLFENKKTTSLFTYCRAFVFNFINFFQANKTMNDCRDLSSSVGVKRRSESFLISKIHSRCFEVINSVNV
jgi:hypothetical protein